MCLESDFRWHFCRLQCWCCSRCTLYSSTIEGNWCVSGMQLTSSHSSTAKVKCLPSDLRWHGCWQQQQQQSNVHRMYHCHHRHQSINICFGIQLKFDLSQIKINFVFFFSLEGTEWHSCSVSSVPMPVSLLESIESVFVSNSKITSPPSNWLVSKKK